MIFETNLVGFNSFTSKKTGEVFVRYCVEDVCPPANFKGKNYFSGIASGTQIPDPALGDTLSVSTDRFGRIVDIQKHIIRKEMDKKV